MGRLIVTEFVSMDGVMEAPGGEEGYKHSGWSIEHADPGQYEYKIEELQEADVQLLGRRTYEGFAAAWPEREDDPEDTVGFAKRMNAMPKYVVSSTLDEATWQNTTILRDVEEVRALRDEVDGNILVAGSNMLVHWLLREDLVDELRLMIHPVMLGSGKRVFPELEDKLLWELADHRQYGSVVVHAYRPVGR